MQTLKWIPVILAAPLNDTFYDFVERHYIEIVMVLGPGSREALVSCPAYMDYG